MTAPQSVFFWCGLALLMGCAGTVEALPDETVIRILSFFAGGITAIVAAGGVYVAYRAVNRIRRGVRASRGRAEINP